MNFRRQQGDDENGISMLLPALMLDLASAASTRAGAGSTWRIRIGAPSGRRCSAAMACRSKA